MANPVTIVRGTTVFFSTTFYDQSGNLMQPDGAVINLEYYVGNAPQTVLLTMTAPQSPATAWTATWDTRGIDPAPVQWSVHSVMGGIPYIVQDGNFSLAANTANLTTF